MNKLFIGLLFIFGALVLTSFAMATSVESIVLTPNNAINVTSGTHTVYAKVLDASGNPRANVPVLFTKNRAFCATSYELILTDASGIAELQYISCNHEGTDHITAQCKNTQGLMMTSNTVERIWSNNEVPEFGIIGLIVIAISSIAIFLYKRK